MARPSILPPRGSGGSDATTTATPAVESATKGASPTKIPSDAGPLEGKTTIDEKLSIECEMLCYRAMSKIAARIAEEFERMKPVRKQIIILDEAFKKALQLREEFVFQASMLHRGFSLITEAGRTIESMATPQGVLDEVGITNSKMIVPSVTPSITAATSLGRSVVDLLALFRTDVSYSGRPVAIREESLVLELAGKLRRKNTSVIYPKLLLYRPSAPRQASQERLDASFRAVLTARDVAEETVRRLAGSVAEHERELGELLSQKSRGQKHGEMEADDKVAERKEGLIPERLKLAAQRAQFAALDAQLKGLQSNLTTPDVRSGVVPLQLLQQAEEMLARFSETTHETFFLWAQVATSSGSYQVRRNLFRTLLFSDGLRYSGGAVVTFAFLDGDANVVLSGVHRYREPFTRFPSSWGGRTEGNSF